MNALPRACPIGCLLGQTAPDPWEGGREGARSTLKSRDLPALLSKQTPPCFRSPPVCWCYIDSNGAQAARRPQPSSPRDVHAMRHINRTAGNRGSSKLLSAYSWVLSLPTLPLLPAVTPKYPHQCCRPHALGMQLCSVLLPCLSCPMCSHFPATPGDTQCPSHPTCCTGLVGRKWCSLGRSNTFLSCTGVVSVQD